MCPPVGMPLLRGAGVGFLRVFIGRAPLGRAVAGAALLAYSPNPVDPNPNWRGGDDNSSRQRGIVHWIPEGEPKLTTRACTSGLVPHPQ